MVDWKRICTLSLVHFMAYPELQSGNGNFIPSIHEIGQKNFFGAVELGTIHDKKKRREVRRVVESYELKVGFGAQPIILGQNLNLHSFDPFERHKALHILKPYIDQAAEMQADRFVILSGKDPGDLDRSDAYRLLKESIISLGEYADQYRISIVLETFDRSIDKKALVGPSKEAAILAAAIKVMYPKFGLLYDMGHMPLLDEEPKSALKILHEHLAEVHLGNCVKITESPIYGDKHPSFGYEGGENSTTELVSFIQALFETGYLNVNQPEGPLPWVGFEIRPHQGQCSFEILDNIQSTWKNAWSQLQ